MQKENKKPTYSWLQTLQTFKLSLDDQANDEHKIKI
jgi:hypothetical protein